MPKLKPHHIVIVTLCLIIIAGIGVGGFFFFRSRLQLPPTPHETEFTSDTIGPPYNFDHSWTESSPYIAHAFGGIAGDTYTNSLEAFLLNYQLGHRVFEVDFSITDDGHTVLAHDADDWRIHATVQPDSDDKSSSPAFTYNNFMSSLWYGKYHPLDVEDLLHLLQEYPDIYIITDTKYSDQEHVNLQFSEFINTARKIDESLLDRFIPQIYLPEMLDYIMAIHPWKSVIYTLYANPNWTTANVLEFCQSTGVKFVTLFWGWSNQDMIDLWHSAGIKTAAHTVNNLNNVARLRALGIDYFYTDFLRP